MKRPLLFLLVGIFLISQFPHAQEQARLTVKRQGGSSFVFITQHEFHQRYGIGFPLTFRFNFSGGATRLTAKERSSATDSWKVIPEELPGEVPNNEDIVRFDYSSCEAYVSATFSNGDSLFLDICDSLGYGIHATYAGIAEYYDGRKAVVTVSADDWFDEYTPEFQSLLELFRSYGIPVTVGVTTGYMNDSTWEIVRKEVETGGIEIASHSRTHPFSPYSDVYSEVVGSMDDIKTHLRMPTDSGHDNVPRVYVWIAPSGDYDSTIDSLLSIGGYLVPRLYLNLPATPHRLFTYGESHFSAWGGSSNHFEPCYPTVEIGAPYWGGGDTSVASLNALFDDVEAKGEVYHAMWHPQVIYEDRSKPYLLEHLSHISHRPEIWYVCLGPLYLYHMIQEANDRAASCVQLTEEESLPEPVVILLHYPMPSRSSAAVRFEVRKDTFVDISIFDSRSHKVLTLVRRDFREGTYELSFDTSVLAVGSYMLQLAAGSEVVSKSIEATESR